MPVTYCYRLNGGQILGSTINADGFGQIDTSIVGTVTDPPMPDGADFSSPKCFDTGVIRNATAQEIADFPTREAEDEATLARTTARDNVDNERALRAIVHIIIDELNILRAEHGLAARTVAQARRAIRNRIDADDGT